MNLWHDIPMGPNPPDLIHVVVEIPGQTRNKYEYDHHLGVMKLDRVLASSLHYPADYGLIPQSLYGDGDPLDVLVLIKEPTFTGCLLTARPIGIFKMLDQGEPDDKILAVVQNDPLYEEFEGLRDVPPHFLREVGHFFSVYKDLEGKRVEVLGWGRRDEARQQILMSQKLYQEKYGKK